VQVGRPCDRLIVVEATPLQVQVLGPGACALSGALTFDSVPRLYPQAAVWLAAAQAAQVNMDLAEVQSIDSAGLALLVAWQGKAAAAHIRLQYSHIPQRALALAQISEATDLLGPLAGS